MKLQKSTPSYLLPLSYGVIKNNFSGDKVMLIDMHTHLWPSEKTPDYLRDYFKNQEKENKCCQLTYEGLLNSMDRAGIEKAVVLALSFSPDWANEELGDINKYVIQQTKKTEGRLIPFCTINPFERNSVDYLRKMIEIDGFFGLKLHCNIQQFYPNDDRLYPIYTLMQQYNKPILFHSGGIGIRPIKDRFGQPIHFDDVACDFPELPMILGHAGRIWYHETAMLLRKHKNVFADISTNFGRTEKFRNYPMEQLLHQVKGWTGTVDKLLFGSDYPFYSQSGTVEALEEMLQTRSDHELVAATDIKNIFTANSQVFCKQYNLIK
ncbi:amidohydrolase family protein [Petroclostridium sp. X23]|uniref:amidohydrolase family protein n=1 Tax=Petroclostridium sp. X23 TaxID=3045146 RepID=UPI0024ADF4A6|nr:amidohydrolase family protein [Petroclostridium sp. X23]WHH57124.1 amidohydrolase family protein [Petroclostridium sp. X23]